MTFKVAAVQLNSINDKQKNIDKAVSFIQEAASEGAKLISLPEYFNFIGENEEKFQAAETIPGKTTDQLGKVASQEGVYIHIGSLIEDSEVTGKISNTSVVIAPSGNILATYRKLHLFDVNVPGKVNFKESDTIAPGETPTLLKTKDIGTLGLSICYDIRFPELYRSLALNGAEIILTPAAFALNTGKDHWESILRCRAIENQAYIIAAGQVGTHPGSFPTFGNSMIIEPWGTVLARQPDYEGYVITDISLDRVSKMRTEIPVFNQRRADAYKKESVTVITED